MHEWAKCQKSQNIMNQVSTQCNLCWTCLLQTVAKSFTVLAHCMQDDKLIDTFLSQLNLLSTVRSLANTATLNTVKLKKQWTTESASKRKQEEEVGVDRDCIGAHRRNSCRENLGRMTRRRMLRERNSKQGTCVQTCDTRIPTVVEP